MTIDRILDAVVEIKGTEMSIDDVPEKKFTDDPKAVTSCYIKWRGLNYADCKLIRVVFGYAPNV
jgi:hypothetical protein